MKTGLARQEFNRIRKIIDDMGYKETDSLEEFWNKNSHEVNDRAYGNGGYGSFDTQIRWHFELGKIILASIKEYLKAKVLETYTPNNFSNRVKVLIDFSNWSYKYKGQTIASTDFNKLEVYDSEGKTYNLFDFSGIDLSEISLRNCIIKNCHFDSAFFDSASFDNVEFEDCMLDYSSFHKANLSTVGFGNGTTIRGILLDAAWVENLKNLNNDSLPISFRYTEVKYTWILKKLFKSVFTSEGISLIDMKGQEHTTFMNINVEGLTRSNMKIQTDYINWFQSLTGKLYSYKRLSFKTKIGFFLSAIMTKYWSSFTALGVSALVINIFYTLIYFINAYSFNTLHQDSWWETLIKSFYYSAVTFMTLGYGDVFPKFYGGQILVITEVTLGYIVLGLFVYLVSRKVDKLY